jgi:small subunit ribosomal protein S4
MGDPKKPRKNYDPPSHPWRGERIKEEKELMIKYGLKNKTEVYKAYSYLRNLRSQARTLQARNRTGDSQAAKESELLLKRCIRLGFLADNSSLQDILGLNVEHILSRRFQTLVYNKGLSQTPFQARQMISHGHVQLNTRKVTIPGVLVGRNEERTIEYTMRSPFTNEEHPMRPKSQSAETTEMPSQVADKINIKVEGGES